MLKRGIYEIFNKIVSRMMQQVQVEIAGYVNTFIFLRAIRNMLFEVT